MIILFQDTGGLRKFNHSKGLVRSLVKVSGRDRSGLLLVSPHGHRRLRFGPCLSHHGAGQRHTAIQQGSAD